MAVSTEYHSYQTRIVLANQFHLPHGLLRQSHDYIIKWY